MFNRPLLANRYFLVFHMKYSRVAGTRYVYYYLIVWGTLYEYSSNRIARPAVEALCISTLLRDLKMYADDGFVVIHRRLVETNRQIVGGNAPSIATPCRLELRSSPFPISSLAHSLCAHWRKNR